MDERESGHRMRSLRWNKLTKDLANVVMPWAAAMMGLILLGHALFYEGTTWWTWSLSLTLSVTFLAAFLLLEAVVSGRKVAVKACTFAGVALFCFGSLGFSGALLQADLSDLRHVLNNTSVPLHYSNTRKEKHSEWGYIAHLTGREAFFSKTFEELFKAGKGGHLLVFTQAEELGEFWGWMKSTGRQSEFERAPQVHLWRRWPKNIGQLRQLWRERASTENLWDKSTRHFFILNLNPGKEKVLAGP